MQFKLVGREEALADAAACFSNIIHGKGCDHNSRPIPVCSGLSGLGKTRMLEEGDAILTRCGILDKKMCVIVPYFDGHGPQPVETTMTIEASFAWRLLHRVFIEGNGLNFDEWFRSRLPSNGRQLTLEFALDVIYQKVLNLRID